MYESTEMTLDQIQTGMWTGDKQKQLEMVNAVLTGSVVPKTEDAVSTGGTDGGRPEEGQSVEPTTTDGQLSPSFDSSVNTESESEVTPLIDYEQEERERQARLNEFRAQQAQDEKERILLEKRETEERLEEERKANEELKNRLQMLTELQSQQHQAPNGTTNDDEDDEYVSDYAKRTRKELEELKAMYSANDPRIQKFIEKADQYEAKIQSELEARERQRAKEAADEAERKAYGSIREFQRTVPELQTSVDIQEVEKEYFQFRRDLSSATKAKSKEEFDRYMLDYFKGGEVKKLADGKGITLPKDYDTYQKVVELADMKRGVTYDPTLGKEIPILNDEGRQVTYRSLEEAYRVKNYPDEMNRIRKQVIQDYQNKLNEARSGARTLDNETTVQFTGGLTTDQVKQVLAWKPHEFINDPERRELVKQVYRSQGLDSPKIRGMK